MRLVQQIKMAQKSASISQDDHIANVMDISNNRTTSCTVLTHNEQQELLHRYKGMAPQTKKQLPKQLKLIYSLWAQLANKGLVNENSKQACDSFCEKHTNGQKLYNANKSWQSIIEILKGWLARGSNHG